MEALDQENSLLNNSSIGETLSHLRASNDSQDNSQLRVVKIYDLSDTRSLRKLNNELATTKIVAKNKHFVKCLGASMDREALIFSDV
jgi:hypothetical protein